MRARLCFLTLSAAIAVLSGIGFARADSSTPFPTPVTQVSPLPTPTESHLTPPSPVNRRAPSAATLLRLMRAAMVRQGSVHVDFHMISGLYPTGEAATHLSGDVSWKLDLLHDRTIVQKMGRGEANAAPLQTIDLRLVHQHVASHNRSGGWQCSSLAHVQVMSTLLGLEETVLSAHVAGPGEVNGLAVWKVRATGYSPATGSGTVAHIRYDIAQSDSTLQRVEVTGTPSFAGRKQQIVASEVYTHYGEAVTVRLPAACNAR